MTVNDFRKALKGLPGGTPVQVFLHRSSSLGFFLTRIEELHVDRDGGEPRFSIETREVAEFMFEKDENGELVPHSIWHEPPVTDLLTSQDQ